MRMQLLAILFFAILQGRTLAQEAKSEETPGATPEQIEEFAKRMTGATFIGRFTDGSGESKEERYEIKEAKKLGGDTWVFTARIVYGDIDLTVPVPIQVKWAEKTPVITLDETTIPGMGTFSAYVIVDGDKYAGTWQHDDHGGHLFGKIEKKNGSENANN